MAGPDLIKMIRTSIGLRIACLILVLLFQEGCENKDEMTAAIKERADRGDSEAQWRLGVNLLTGNTTDDTKAAAFQWISKSANHGNRIGEFWLGKLYWTGQGTETNRSEALHWIQKSAEKGLADAETWMGKAYLNGDGLNQSYKQAQSWLKRAAEHNSASGQYELGLLYTHHHQDMPWDFKKAQIWITKAANRGYRPAQTWLASYLAHPREGKPDPVNAYTWALIANESGSAKAISAHLTSSQIATAQRRASQFKPLRGGFWAQLTAEPQIYWLFATIVICEFAAVYYVWLKRQRQNRVEQ
jgi:TPR repeat protein